jgi:hypothetical protein
MREASLDFDLKGAHISVDWDASSKRPGFQSNLSAGTHMGVRNLAPTHVGSSKTYLDLTQRLAAGGPGYPGQTRVNREHGHAEP